jgi:hypothetical protein
VAFCEHCGAKFAEADRYCTSCGSAAGSSLSAPAQHTNDRHRRLLVFGAALLVVLAGLGIGAIFHRLQSVTGTAVDQFANLPQQSLPPTPSPRFAYVARATKQGKVYYKVKYQPWAVVFDEPATERALRGVTADGATYVLDSSEPNVRQLKPGSVLFLYGVALRRVTAVQTTGPNTVVTTTQADLTDAIYEGTIAWQVPIDFTAGTNPSLRSPPTAPTTSWLDLLARPAWAGEVEPLKFEGSFADVNYDIEFVRKGPRLKIDLTIKYAKLAGAVIELKGDGYVEHITSIAHILIKNSKLAEVDVGTDGFNGKGLFTWTAQQTDPVIARFREVKVRIPGASVKVPLIVGGLPLILEVSAAVIVHPALISRGAFSTGQFTMSYDATTGLKFTNGDTSGEGKMEDTQAIEHDTAIFGLGPAGFVGALEMPRIEVTFGLVAPSHMVEFNKAALLAKLAHTLGFSDPTPNKLGEEFMLPIEPFAFADIVTSASAVTSGVTGTMPPVGAVMRIPCEKVKLVVAAYVGGGVNIGFKTDSIAKRLSEVGMLPTAVETAVRVFHKESQAYKNGVKCLGDT